ncbi:MAG: cytochrome bc complex cytochrome b subunit [Thermoproteota archaeon]|jgi:Cytochrome b subunit of the bc complex
MSNILSKISDWLDQRIGLTKNWLRPIPEYGFDFTYWFGAIAFINFMILVVSGILLAFYYTPSAALNSEGIPMAYASTQYIDTQVPLGWLLRTLHLYAAYGMIISAFLHLVRNYITGAYKKPRELMWVAGLLMGFAMLGSAFTGYLLPYNQISFYATVVGYNLALSIPGVGTVLGYLIAGAGTQDIVQRFYLLHIYLMPGILLILLGIKLYMFENHGLHDPFRDIKKTLIRVYNWFPRGVYFVGVLFLIDLSILLTFASLFPNDLGLPYNPNNPPAVEILPEWYFFWVYELIRVQYPQSLLSLLSSMGIANPAAVFPLFLLFLALIYLFFLPAIDRSKNVHPKKRFWIVTVGAIMFGEVIILSFIPWLFQNGFITLDEMASLPLMVASLLLVDALMIGIVLIVYAYKKWL